MNRHQKELRLAELKVSRDILNQQIDAIQRELATEGLEIWKNRVEEPRCPSCNGVRTFPSLMNLYVGAHVRCVNAFHMTFDTPIEQGRDIPSDVCPACGRLTEYRGLIKVGAVTAPCSHPCHGPDTPQA